MKRFLSIFLVGIIFAILIPINSSALNMDNVQVTLKSKNLGPDPNFGGNRATITLTINKMGHLAYTEEYYGIDSEGQPKFFSGNRHEEDMKDYVTSFDLIRPKNNHKQDWSLIKSKVILDREVVYETWINTSGTYRSFSGKAAWFNNSSMEIGRSRPTIQKKEPFNPLSSDTEIKIENVSINESPAQKTPMPGIYVTIGILFSTYIFTRKMKRK